MDVRSVSTNTTYCTAYSMVENFTNELPGIVVKQTFFILSAWTVRVTCTPKLVTEMNV